MPYNDVTNALKVASGVGNLPKHLPYHGLESGVTFTLDNKMTFGLKLSLVSPARATPDVRLSTRDRIKSAVQGALPPGATVRFYLENRPATRSALAALAPEERTGSPLERMLGANHEVLERMRRSGWVSESEAYLTVTLPVPGRPQKTPYRNVNLQPLIERAQTLQQRLSRQLTISGMQATVMTDVDIWGRIFDYFNPQMASAEKPPYQRDLDVGDYAAVRVGRKLKHNPKAARPAVATMRAQVACSDIDLDHDDCFTVGSSRVGIVSFLKPSRASSAGVTEQIVQALGGTQSTFVVEYLVVDAPKVRAQINESLDKQESAASDPTMKAGREVYTRIGEGTALVQSMESGDTLTEMSMHAIIFARSQEELDNRRERTLAAFSGVGGSMPRIASGGSAVLLYLENAPFSGKRSSYQVPAMYGNAVDCMPQSGPWRGTPGGALPLRGRRGNVFSITPVGLRNAGVVVAASAGSGKSVLVSMLAAGLIHQHDASLTVVDPKRDYIALFMALNAMDAVVSIAPRALLPNGDRVRINPFDLPVGEEVLTADKIAFLLELLRALRINDLSGRRVSILNEAIRQLYRRFSRPVNRSGEEINAYTGEGTLSDFADIIARLNTVGDKAVGSDPVLRDEVSNVANELRAFTRETPLGTLLDGPTTVNVQSRYLYLDISGMMAHPQLMQVGMLLTNELVWARSMSLSGKKVMVMEEAGVAKNLPGLVDLTNRMFKTGRSLGVIPILVMQEIEDALAYKGVINNASTRILLASNASERAQIADIYALNGAMRALHASLGGEAGRYRELLILQDGMNGQMDGDVGQLWLSKEAYWLSTSVKEEAEYRAQVAHEHYGGDEAQAAIHIAQEERHAA
jgi:conjugal transfer ATP-binding protein TraC